LRVAGPEALRYWRGRLAEMNVVHSGIVERDGRLTLDLEDAEGQRLSLVADERGGEIFAWDRSPVPAEHQVRGLGPITISVPSLEPTEGVLTDLMKMRRAREYALEAGTDSNKSTRAAVHVFEMGEGGPAAELHVAVEPDLPPARYGSGGVHHVAFRIPTFEEYDQWAARLNESGIGNSGPVDRFYFRSLYFREPAGILFELATDEPGFAADEPLKSLGEKLSLPPFLEEKRKVIEARLRPL
jgi:glyoxalase family protein